MTQKIINVIFYSIIFISKFLKAADLVYLLLLINSSTKLKRRNQKPNFVIIPDMVLYKLLQKMGYRFVEKEKDLFFKYKGVKNLKKITKKEANKESPFKVLKQLNFN